MTKHSFDLEAQTANAGLRAFGPTLICCPDCGHGIDPHGSDPGGPCGTNGCKCLMTPNGIACLIGGAALEQAWDKGYVSGHSRAMRRMSDEPNVAPGVNPYKKESRR